MVPRCGGYFGHSGVEPKCTRNTNNEIILYGDSIHKEVWKLLKGEWTPVANGGVWCGAKCWFQVKHIDDRPLDFAIRSSSPEPAASRFHRQIPQDLTVGGGLIMLYYCKSIPRLIFLQPEVNVAPAVYGRNLCRVAC